MDFRTGRKKRIFNSCAFMIKVLFVSLPKKRDIRRQILSVIPPEFLWQSFWWNNCLGSYAIDIADIASYIARNC